MTRHEFERLVFGRRIAAVEWCERDSLGHVCADDDRVIDRLILDTGAAIELSGSEQICVRDVQADYCPPPPPSPITLDDGTVWEYIGPRG